MELLTEAELAKKLRMSISNVRRLRGLGMPHVDGGPGDKVLPRYIEEDVFEWLVERTKKQGKHPING